MKKLNFKWLLLSIILSIACITQVDAATRRYYCKMTYSWWTTSSAAIACYAWNDSGNNGWPGKKMTATGTSGEWYIDLDTKYTKVIFTRVNSAGDTYWSAKTGDLTLDENNYYTITSSSGVWDPSTVAGSWSKYAPTPAIIGSMNSWKPDANIFSGTSGSVTCSISLSANTVYEFKVITGAKYNGYGSTGDLAYFGQSGNTTLGDNSGDNIRLATAGAGTYTFTYNTSTRALSVAYPSVTHPSGDYVYFKNTGSWTNVKAHVFTGSTAIDNWPGPIISSFNFDGTNYYYAALGDKTSIVFSKSGDDSKKTGDLTTASSNKGKYYDYSSSTWKNFTATLTLNHQSPTNTPAPNSITVTYGASTNLTGDVITTSPTKTGYTFGGYYTSAAGGGSQLIGTNENVVASVSNYTDGSKKWIRTGSSVSTTLYAKWTQTLNLNSNGATNDGTTSVTATFNGGIGSIATAPTKTGYTFGGWYPNSDGTGVQVINASKALQASKTDWTDSNTKWIHAGASTLYAKWTQRVTLDANTSYGGSGNGYADVIFNGAKTAYSAATASSGSYALKGYFTNTTGGTQVIDKDGNLIANITNWTDASGNWIHAGSSTLYAQWKTTYTLHYEGNGNTGGTAPDDEEWTMNTTATVAGNTGSLVKTNYSFGGWNTAPEGNGTNYEAGSGTFTISANTNLYAKWNEVMRDITIVGGTTSSTTAGVVTTGSATAAAPAAGKKFTGWNIGAGVTLTGCVATDRTITFTATADATVTAQYADRAQVKMYFAKPTISGWTNAYAYVWKSSDDSKKNKAYPGVQLASTETINHVVYYTYQYYTEADGIGGAADGSSEWNSVIFNNGQSGDNEKKTADLTVSNGHYYVRSSTGTGKAAALTSAWCVKGAWNSWNEDTDQITHTAAATGSKSITLTTGNKEFKIYNIVNETWWRFSGNVSATKAATTIANNIDGNMTITPSVAGPYTFALASLTGTPTLAITYPTTYTVTFNAETFVNGDASHSTSTTGGTLSAVDGNSAALSSGGKVLTGGSAVITASKNTGYDFIGFYTSAACTSELSGAGVSISDNVLTFSSIGANKTAYAKFSEKMTTVTIDANNEDGGTITVGGSPFTWGETTTAGVTTGRAIVVTPATGYYFAGWTKTEGTDYKLGSDTEDDYGESATSKTLKGKGSGATSGQTLTANFQPLEKIYFRDVFDDGSTVTHWGDVYVYLGITWNESNQAVTNSSHNDWRIHMTQIGKTNVWWAYVPRNFTTTAAPAGKQVGFAKTNQNGTSYTFYNTKAATRGDYNKALNMFVPFHTAKTTGNNSVDYFDNGYWMKYDTRANQGAGYYIKQYNKRNDYTQKGEFIATNDDATFIEFQLRIDAGNSTLTYMLTSAGGLNYLADAAITSANCTSVGVSENTQSLSDNDVKFDLTTTSEGIYTFVLDQSGDKMKLSVKYPVEIGDYKLVHSYSDGGTKYAYSDIIKAAEISGKTVSMYLNMATATKDLKLYKCTSISAGKPVWGSSTTVGTGTGLFNTTTFDEGKGVYVFDVTISSNAVSKIENAGLYDGDFYIKTNSAPGGWANYKLNVMDKNTINFSKDNANTFDYSMCRWVGDMVTNVKCVIANDYNNAVSDTLVSDAILTRSAVAYETLPEAANVRFSYNSTTNTLKRTYLKGSTLSTNFVTLVPNAATYVYSAASAGTDYYSSNPKFSDNGNWTYAMEAYVYPGAQAGVQTSYPTAAPVTTQTLVPLTNYLMGGTTKGSTRYHVKLVYDFKTDYLMSAWMAGGNLDDPMTLNSDFIVVRNGQSDADQISFSGDGAISSAKRAYGVFEFSRSAMVGNMGSWNSTSYGLCMYYFSFPFDVKVSDIFGVGTMGTDWRIQKYNGAKRADKGWFLQDGTTTFWEDVTEDEVLNKYEGYSLLLNRINFNNGSNSVWTNIPNDGHTYLYFPSKDLIGSIEDQTNVTIHVPEHECKIDREFSQDIGVKEHPRNHKYTDSHWNMVGTPLFQDMESNSIQNCVLGDSTLKYIYAWNSSDNTLAVRATLTTSHEFRAMYAYMVQYAGDVKFTGASIKPASIAARQKKEEKKYNLELELTKGERFAGRTYVELRENACDTFELNEDLYMMNSSRTADIYTFAGGYDLAANVLSVGSHIVPVGVNVKSAGTFTFAMPSDFDGEVVLVDKFNGERTNLAMSDYEVYLEKGEINDRFDLEINIKKVATAIDGGGSFKDGKAHKFIENGVLYILRDGKVYDATGNLVK